MLNYIGEPSNASSIKGTKISEQCFFREFRLCRRCVPRDSTVFQLFRCTRKMHDGPSTARGSKHRKVSLSIFITSPYVFCIKIVEIEASNIVSLFGRQNEVLGHVVAEIFSENGKMTKNLVGWFGNLKKNGKAFLQFVQKWLKFDKNATLRNNSKEKYSLAAIFQKKLFRAVFVLRKLYAYQKIPPTPKNPIFRFIHDWKTLCNRNS